MNAHLAGAAEKEILIPKGISYPKDMGMKTALIQVASLESIVPSNNG